MASKKLVTVPRASINIAPDYQDRHENIRRLVLLHDLTESQRTNEDARYTYIRTLEIPKSPCSKLVVIGGVLVCLLELALTLVIFESSLSLLPKTTLPFAIFRMLVTLLIFTSVWLLMAKLIQKALSVFLEGTRREENMRSKVRRKDSGREVVRFQFEIDPDLWNALERFQQDGGLTTKRELLNNALTLFKWAAQHKEKGNSITAIAPTGTVHELEMPVLESIELNSQRKIRLVNAESEEEKSKAVASAEAA